MNKKAYKIYIADCAADGGIYLYDFADGTLTEKQKLALDRPMYLAVENKKLYAVLRAPFDGSDKSGILSFDIGTDGESLNRSGIISTEGRVCCHLCVKNAQVFDANYISGSVNKLGVKTVTHTGHGVNPARQDAPHVHFTNFSPDGKYILSCDLGIDTVFVYDFDLNEVSRARVPDGHGVRHLAYSGNTVYAVNELKSTVSVFDYKDGKLSYVTTVNALPDCFAGENTSAAIRISGDRMYVSHRGYDGICVFDISEKIPKLINAFKSGGKSPRDFIIVDKYIIVTNESGEVCVFDTEHYKLQQTVNLISPLCAVCND